MENKKQPSPAQSALLKLGLVTPLDLALHIPFRYEDETQLVPLSRAREGQVVQIEVTITHQEILSKPRRQLKLEVTDGNQVCTVRFFNAYPSLAKQLAPGSRVRLRGEIRGGMFGLSMMHPSVSRADAPLPKKLTPVYATTAALPQAYIRKAVLGGLSRAIELGQLEPTIDPSLEPSGLMPLKDALVFLHGPGPKADLRALESRTHDAWVRLKADELLAQQLSQLKARNARAQTLAVQLKPQSVGAKGQDGGAPSKNAEGVEGVGAVSVVQALREVLPFELTRAQTRVVQEIERDLIKSVPMHRLLQGDVGSGKTVVAALAAAQCVDAGWQCALMAPTEILAHQHFEKLHDWLQPCLSARGLKVAWLTGSQKKKEKREALADIESGAAALVIGTHAVIQEQVVFKNLALAIIDEQHRFGVAQRLALRQKIALDDPNAGTSKEGTPVSRVEPHLLMMSATPIPRTLAMSYFADLDVSTLDELPPGRTPVVTKLLSDNRRAELLMRIKDQLRLGQQVYWVCPLIEESESLDLTNATQTHLELSQALGSLVVPLRGGESDRPASLFDEELRPRDEGQEKNDDGSARDRGLGSHAINEGSSFEPSAGGEGGVPKDFDGVHVQVGLLHSRMPEHEKKEIMQAFKSGSLHVLVSTTVIEVGVDVPNASLMVIEHAERFGLSQLHQLRGRVGRGRAASACVLLYSLGEHGRLSDTAQARLKAMIQTQDGFEIAKRDLEIRGPGEFLGSRQSGASLMRFADPLQDFFLLEWAQGLAPKLWEHDPKSAQAHLERWQSVRAEYLKA